MKNFIKFILASVLIASYTTSQSLDIKCPDFYEGMFSENEILQKFKKTIEKEKINSIEKK